MKKALLAGAVTMLLMGSAQAENIGVSMAKFDDNFLTVLRNSMIDYAKGKSGVTLQVEDAQNDALAELRGQSRNAQIHAATGDIFLDATILWQPALRDVHARHHFHPRDYR